MRAFVEMWGLKPKKFLCFSPSLQVGIFILEVVTGLLLVIYSIAFNEGLDWYYALATIGPFYEEIIFRGIIQSKLEKRSVALGIIGTSLLFGLWHAKGFFWFPLGRVIRQVLITTLIYGPIFSILKRESQTVWPSLILHYANNIILVLLAILFDFHLSFAASPHLLCSSGVW